MRTLYLRKVPDSVLERLERLAERRGTSVSAAAIRELDESTRWVENAALFDAMPTVEADIDAAAIVAAIEDGRDEA